MVACEACQIGQRRVSNEFALDDDTAGMSDLFAKFEKAATSVAFFSSLPLPSPAVLSIRQKAEFEVNEYLSARKVSKDGDPFLYWAGENEAKWPLLSNLASRYLAAPATSAESESYFLLLD
ncbi:hypothetical protein GPALN_007472 [Globodera pallida]|nr:hypothetical protein GPALN_007472 [Globodera pallida]